MSMAMRSAPIGAGGCGVIAVMMAAVLIVIILGLVWLGWWLRGVCS